MLYFKLVTYKIILIMNNDPVNYSNCSHRNVFSCLEVNMFTIFEIY